MQEIEHEEDDAVLKPSLKRKLSEDQFLIDETED